jgi:hypothetical protein
MTDKPIYYNGSNFEGDSSIRFMPSIIAESPLILQ